MMEILPFLDENDIIGIKSEALGADSPAHKRFRENQPLPEDNLFVPMSAVTNLSSDVLSRARSLRSRKTSLQAALTKESNSAAAKTSDQRPTMRHSHALPSASSSGLTTRLERRALNAVQEKHRNTDASHSVHEWSDIFPPNEDPGPPPAYATLQLTTEDDADDPPAYEKLQITSDVGMENPPLFDEKVWNRDIAFDGKPNGKNASAAVEYEDPPPEFTQEDLRLQEAIWAERRAKKAAARAAKGQKVLGASAAAALTRADDVTANGKNASAAVEYEDPPPEFTQEDLRLQEAIWAERRAKKAAARAAKRRD